MFEVKRSQPTVINCSGRNGSSGGDPNYYGQEGENGRHGENGRDLALVLTADARHYVHVTSSAHRDDFLFLLGGSQASFTIISNGGQGGNGGVGGNGANGRDGEAGQDATRYEGGTDGTTGGRGGNGGDGGNGGNGGNGGQITIRVAEEYTPLLMVIDWDISVLGGKAGCGGAGGRGGRGGSGGRGGHSYSWTEYDYVRKTYSEKRETEEHKRWGKICRDIRDDITSVERYYPPEPTEFEWFEEEREERVDTHHHSPGGYGGSNGAPGLNGCNGGPGKNGMSGSVKIINTSTGRSYSSIYDLSLQEVFFQSPDGIIEPGEKLELGIVVKNIGGMPTPKKNPIRITLECNEWISADQSGCLLHQSIAPSEHFRWKSDLEFRINRNDEPSFDTTFFAKGLIKPNATMTMVNRPFQHVNWQGWVNIQYPVEISVIANVNAVSEGGEAPITFALRNISTQDIGKDTPGGRLLSLSLAQEASQGGPSLVFKTRSGDSQASIVKPMDISIGRIRAGEECILSGTLQFENNGNRVPFSKVKFQARLNLGCVDNPQAQQKTIQVRTSSIQLSESYNPHQQTDFVFIVNNLTTADEIVQWRNWLQYFGLTMQTWNVSLYGGVDYFHERKDGGSFVKELQNRVVIFLNNGFEAEKSSGKSYAHHYLAASELFRAARYFNVITGVIGGDFSLEEAAYPPSVKECKSYKSYPSEEEFLEEYVAAANSADRKTFEGFYKFPVTIKTSSRRPPSKSVLQQAGDRLLNRLRILCPNQKHYATYDYQVEQLDNSDFLWQVGILNVQHGLDRNRAQLGCMTVNDESVHQVTESMIYFVVKLLSFQRKLELIDSVMKLEKNEFRVNANILLRAMLSDLADEYCAFTTDGKNGPLDKDALRPRLTALNTLYAYNFKPICENERGKLFLRLLLGKYKRMVKEALGYIRRHKSHTANTVHRPQTITGICKEKINGMLSDYFKIVSKRDRKKDEDENIESWKEWDGERERHNEAVLGDCQRPSRFGVHAFFSSYHQKVEEPQVVKQNSSQIEEDQRQLCGEVSCAKRNEFLRFFEERNKPVYDSKGNQGRLSK